MIPEKKYSVIIVAGGKGLRAGSDLPKQFCTIGTKPMLMHTIEAFYRFDYRLRIVLVLPVGYTLLWEELCAQYRFSIAHEVAIGGDSRFQSVKNGLELISEEETVGIHDAARPFVSGSVIGRCYETAFEHDCGAIPVIDEPNSVRRLTAGGSEPVNRAALKIVQTPQVFPAERLKQAYQIPDDPSFTDDASVAERAGIKIRLVPGDERNIKITSSFDLEIADYLKRKGDEPV
ncbi:MAG TPA: 2-C-methyl-D-erythritol 4-phosphate cytidylyltransferase [Porphyromonadaceae bacterium]|nr:2-C-methyl-D-erythritol 4-phosphate cytidylyltransferase [Porphyromonadaceae bacterium]